MSSYKSVCLYNRDEHDQNVFWKCVGRQGIHCSRRYRVREGIKEDGTRATDVSTREGEAATAAASPANDACQQTEEEDVVRASRVFADGRHQYYYYYY